nr:MAG TPA: hypothetical protein [Caudoviricetes sp.]
MSRWFIYSNWLLTLPQQKLMCKYNNNLCNNQK